MSRLGYDGVVAALPVTIPMNATARMPRTGGWAAPSAR